MHETPTTLAVVAILVVALVTWIGLGVAMARNRDTSNRDRLILLAFGPLGVLLWDRMAGRRSGDDGQGGVTTCGSCGWVLVDPTDACPGCGTRGA